MIHLKSVLLCSLFTLDVWAGTIIGIPQTALPSAGSDSVITPALPTGSNTYLMPINLLSFDVVGSAIFHYSTDGLPGESIYTIPVAYENQSTSDWDSFAVTLSVGDIGSAVKISVPVSMPGNPLQGTDEYILIDDQILTSGSSRSAAFELTFGDTPAPQTFSIEFTPRAAPDVPEPGTVLLGMLLMLATYRGTSR